MTRIVVTTLSPHPGHLLRVDREKGGVIVDVPYQQVKDALKVGGAIGTAIVAGLSFLNGKR